MKCIDEIPTVSVCICCSQLVFRSVVQQSSSALS